MLAGAARSEDERIGLAFQHVLSRRPSSGEKDLFRMSLSRLKQEFSNDPSALKKFLGAGESRQDAELDSLDHAYSGICLAILNLDEALTKE